ncbi:HpcH/HpaI aldolase/citrate lyase family protein [Williamsia limnetica]|jgi:citrate lyase beta subunit|uniref:HpcH/HpaI aldolase/citrate lyase family protein n=1 Tax=Williamsia limnetica TaxID=882452 RepID=A0A318S1Y6_WILLI|nr:aldolase/citrate lyase family protein [Williamsia limnetica]PYE20720.1 HpcH/HpaI aldolase/citrate lyase family protein [Williamsia limnetica]
MSADDRTVGISAPARARIDAVLGAIDAELDRDFPGDRPEKQPAHTAYVSAADVDVETPARWGRQGLQIADGAAATLAELDPLGVLPLVRAQLAHHPIEDLRIDLEDGYGWRDNDVEDGHARAAGQVLAAWAAGHPAAPRVFGVRCKGLGATERQRGLRSLELVLDGAGGIPRGFVFTVPKLRAAGQVDAVVMICEELERAHGLAAGTLRFELQIESPQAVLGADGGATVAQAIHRGGTRVTGLHYGTYDYSAACGIVSAQQSLEHPVADHAKAVMLVAAAQTGVWVSDGSTQIAPIGDQAVVDAALRRHHRLVTRSLERGIYQGWDMHPGHLVTRWLAVYSFFRAAMPSAAERLQGYFDRQSSEFVDEPATAQSLALVILRGLAAGAFTEADVLEVGERCSEQALAELRAHGGVLG